MTYGFYIAFISVFFFALHDVFNRYAVVNLGVAPWQFALWQLIFASIALLLFSGREKTGLNTLKHKYTWIIGFCRVTSSALFIPALLYISATEANLLLKFNIFIASALAYIFLQRQPNKQDFIGFAAIIVGLVLLINQQDNGLFSPAIWLVFGASAAITIATILTELHPISNQSISTKARCRYTAIILMVISSMFLLISLLLSQFSGTINTYVSNSGTASLSTFMSAAIIAGVFIRAPMTYFSFKSIRFIKSENFLMAMSLTPFLTISLESVLGFLGVFTNNPISGNIILAATLITGGALFNMINRMAKAP